ncbi:MAG: aminopeptidase P family protein [Spirochaetaceae bacterium]|nr:MAG: aminopeptidase P family protein [Spirochaetaceae bacterium]
MTITGAHDRIAELAARLEQENTDLAVVVMPEHVLMLSGFWPMLGRTVLLCDRTGSTVALIPDCYRQEAETIDPVVDVRFFSFGLVDSPNLEDSLSTEISRLFSEHRWTRIGWERSLDQGAPSWNSADMVFPSAKLEETLRRATEHVGATVDIAPILLDMKRCKNESELEGIRRAGEVSCIGLRFFDRFVESGRTGVEIAAAVEREIMVQGTGYGGARRVRAFAQVATGPREGAVGYRPNEISTDRPAGSGDLVLLELGVVVDGYWADRTRVRCVGGPTETQQQVLSVVNEARQAAIHAIRPGATAGDVDRAARAVVRRYGYGDDFPHITGHGTGFAYHEPYPTIAPNSTAVLEEGMVFTVEPGIYRADLGGVRIEDNVAVTAQGAEVLGPYRVGLSGSENDDERSS